MTAPMTLAQMAKLRLLPQPRVCVCGRMIGAAEPIRVVDGRWVCGRCGE